MATYSQHHMDGLELHLTPLHYFQKCFLDEKEEKLRAHLSNFGIAGELAMHPMYTLSGGQKGRVAFAKVCIYPVIPLLHTFFIVFRCKYSACCSTAMNLLSLLHAQLSCVRFVCVCMDTGMKETCSVPCYLWLSSMLAEFLAVLVVAVAEFYVVLAVRYCESLWV